MARRTRHYFIVPVMDCTEICSPGNYKRSTAFAFF